MSVKPCQLPSTFLVAWRPSVNFCQLYFAARRPSINFCLLPTTFCVDGRTSANCHQLLCDQDTFRQLLSAFHADGRPSVNGHQLSVRPNDLSTSVNFCTSGRTSVKFRQYLSTFRAARTPSVNFLCGREVCQSLSIIRAAGISSVNILCNRETFCHLLSTLLAAERPFINFFQFSVQSGDILTTSVNIPCGRETLHQLSSSFCVAGRFFELPPTFCAATKYSINFCGAARRLSVNFPYHLVTFCPLSSNFSFRGRLS